MTENCPLCGREFGNLFGLDSHVAKVHPNYELDRRPSHTEEAKRKISEGKRGKERKDMLGDKNPAKRPKVRRKISKSLRKRYTNPKNRENMAKIIKSPEIREKISDSLKGKLAGDKNPAKREEVRKKIGNWRRERPQPERFKENHPAKRPEVRRKISNSLKGKMADDKNPAWEGGTSFEPYDEDWNEELREEVRMRDGFRCILCNLSQEAHLALFGKKLHVHHLNGDKKDSRFGNLLTLCIYCHRRIWN